MPEPERRVQRGLRGSSSAAPSPDEHGMKLYTYHRSTSAWRVRIVLHWKQVPHEAIFVHLLRDGGAQKQPEFLSKNPLGQVPLLEVPGQGVLSQSVAIVEYLEEVFPEPPLLPTESWARAQVRRIVEVVNSGMQPIQNLSLAAAVREEGCDPTPIVRRFLERGFAALEELVASTTEGFAVGSTVTLADAFIVPQLSWARRLALDLGRYPRLCDIERRCAEQPAFVAAAPERQPDYEP